MWAGEGRRPRCGARRGTRSGRADTYRFQRHGRVAAGKRLPAAYQRHRVLRQESHPGLYPNTVRI